MTQLNWPEVKEVGVNINFFQLSKIQLSLCLLNNFKEFAEIDKEAEFTSGTERILGLWNILLKVYDRSHEIEVPLKCTHSYCQQMFQIYFSYEEMKEIAASAQGEKENLITTQEVVQLSQQNLTPFLQNKYPGMDLHKIDEMLSGIDPLVSLITQCECPECQRPSEYPVDLEGLALREFWLEQKKLLHDVLMISRHLGWREEDIVNLPRWRRKYYLKQLSDEGII